MNAASCIPGTSTRRVPPTAANITSAGEHTSSSSLSSSSPFSYSSRTKTAAPPTQRAHSTELYENGPCRDISSNRHEPSSSPNKPSRSGNTKSYLSSPAPPTFTSRRKMNNQDKAEKRRSSRACLECRLAKTKCHVTDNQDVCDRCAKFSFECRFVRHHRGRKPVSKLAAIDTDDLDGAAGTSRFGGSDDDMGTDHDSDSAGEDVPSKVDPNAVNEDSVNPSNERKSQRATSKDEDLASAAATDGSQRRGRETVAARNSSSRSHSKSRLHRSANDLHELDANARRRIWEMLAQKIPQRGSTYTFVSKGEVAHDNLQASASKSTSKSTIGASKRASSPSAAHAQDGKDCKSGKAKAKDQARPHPAESSSSLQAAKTSAASQHFASTLRNLLRPVDKRAGATTAEEEAASAVTARYPRLPETLNLFGSKDPVDVGILSMASARRLYAYYFKHLNPWGMNFDPYFVSHDAVRASSSFLYSTILYLASRYIELADADEPPSEAAEAFYGTTFARPRPDNDRVTASISAQLGSHVRSLAITAFALGDRRMETGVAMYLSSVWKEADDHFTILYCSYAAKIMSDIPTELLSLLPPSGPPTKAKNGTKSITDDATTTTLHQQRVRRNQQRQFLFHFIQEHTHLLHFAPRPNFDRGPSLLRNLLAWADDALATEDDILLCADIDSVLLQTKYKSIMERAQAQEKDTLYGGSECFLLLQSFMDELEGWRSRWELQARKIDARFDRDANQLSRTEEVQGAEQDGEDTDKEQRANGDDDQNVKQNEDFALHLPLEARMHLLSVMRSSLVMQISSMAFRASLRDINKAKPAATTNSISNSASSKAGSSSAFSPSALSAMDDRAEQIYYTCLDSALNLLVHTMQMPPSILRHAQDMIMVLAPHAALLATYLISLPLPSLPPNFAATAAAASASDRLGYEYAKVKTRIRRRKEYERKCLELMRDTRESFRMAQVRVDDHVGLCAQYFDSLLNVIEGETDGTGGYGGANTATAVGGARVGRSLLSNCSVLAGAKRSRSTMDLQLDDELEGSGNKHATTRGGVAQAASSENALTRSNSAGPSSSREVGAQQTGTSLQYATRPPHSSNLDATAAETLLNLHSESSSSLLLPYGGSGGNDAAVEGEGQDMHVASGSLGDKSSSPVGSRLYTPMGGSFYTASSSSHHHDHVGHARVGGGAAAQSITTTPPCSSSVGASNGGGSGAFSPGSFISTGMFGHFATAPIVVAGGSSNQDSSSQLAGFHAGHDSHSYSHHHHPPNQAPHRSAEYVQQQQQQHPAAGANEFGNGVAFAPPPRSSVLTTASHHHSTGTVAPTGATTGTPAGSSTPVDWTWLQSFLEVPEFSWM
ncbi:uncharacterized protein MEPE_04720 [Melanopsichium pennsylvanicum]|uniref:Zn(2)-C6 fungal-type domain-containing protein n=1 Tax=Melanopsichium pennsylvanicum TaxID=63383 RepID=A0AAJ5C6N1_9BASI|nr:uncharacterized protein MEPE_04720 [Melanopsichium pennsylvanicum]